MNSIYFDYAATTPMDPEVARAMAPFGCEHFGNASSPHQFGRDALTALEDARQKIAAGIGATPKEIIFTSGATEANNAAIFGIASPWREGKRHIIVSPIEHHSVLEPIEFLQSLGNPVTYLPVDRLGRVNPDDVKKALRDDTALVAIMLASNEIGTIQPIDEIGAITRERGIPLLVDAVQAVGHIPVDVKALQADMLSLSAHKFYGPKGVGALYLRDGVRWERYLRGGDQERNRRASTQNVAGAVGLGRAWELCRERMDQECTEQTRLRDKLLQEVPRRIDGVHVNGCRESRLPNNAHFSFERLEGESLLMSLDMNGMAASMGSACTSGAMEPSHVLRAIGLRDELAFGSLRITIGRWTTEQEIDRFLEELPSMVKALRI